METNNVVQSAFSAATSQLTSVGEQVGVFLLVGVGIMFIVPATMAVVKLGRKVIGRAV